MVLLFDFGGVLTDLDASLPIAAFDRLGFDLRPYLGTFRQKGPFSEIERGTMSIAAFCDSLRASGVRSDTTNKEIIAAWASFLTGVPTERLEMLLKIKQHYSVNVLSNTNEIHWQQAEEDFFRYKGLQVNDFFDHIFLSCRLGMEKPAPELFRHCVECLGVEPEEVLFLDDSEVNCQAARDCGLKALIAPSGSEWFNYFDDNGKLHLSYL